jgi:hypothetical protein
MLGRSKPPAKCVKLQKLLKKWQALGPAGQLPSVQMPHTPNQLTLLRKATEATYSQPAQTRAIEATTTSNPGTVVLCVCGGGGVLQTPPGGRTLQPDLEGMNPACTKPLHAPVFQTYTMRSELPDATLLPSGDQSQRSRFCSKLCW